MGLLSGLWISITRSIAEGAGGELRTPGQGGFPACPEDEHKREKENCLGLLLSQKSSAPKQTVP